MTFADNAIEFNKKLEYTGGRLPPGIRIMNPFREFDHTIQLTETFYRKYYHDHQSRNIILGINPGRFGAGLTGIPFTDPKRLISDCQIDYPDKIAHEPSSVFVYEMIHAYGGVPAFYKDFYINSLCPLGFTSTDQKGRVKNYNYYDSPALIKATTHFMVDAMTKLINLGIRTEICFCFGIGKNFNMLCKLNEAHHFFKKIIALEHPRFIMQYKNSSKHLYIEKYLSAFRLIDKTP